MPRPPLRGRIFAGEVPPIGTIIIFDGQRYVVTGSRKRDDLIDDPQTYIDLTSHCPECGAPFSLYAPVMADHVTRRCAKHRKRGAPVNPRRLSRRTDHPRH